MSARFRHLPRQGEDCPVYFCAPSVKISFAMIIAITHNFVRTEGISQVESLLQDAVYGDQGCTTLCGIAETVSRDNATVIVLRDKSDHQMFITAVEIQTHCRLRGLTFEVASLSDLTDRAIGNYLDNTLNKI